MSEMRCNASLDGHRCELEPGHDGKHQMVDDRFMVRWAAEPSPEVAPTQEIQVTMATVIKALVLCNESRNRLTGFKSTPEFWLLEAHAELEKKS